MSLNRFGTECRQWNRIEYGYNRVGIIIKTKPDEGDEILRRLVYLSFACTYGRDNIVSRVQILHGFGQAVVSYRSRRRGGPTYSVEDFALGGPRCLVGFDD